MEHKDAILERELNILRDRLLLMGGEAELALQRAINALVHRDSDLAQQVLERMQQTSRIVQLATALASEYKHLQLPDLQTLIYLTAS